ncbi:hypothetical protein [Clostridium folliculivorans]|uniref:hypothetical protein n=1 Tax=Clostridium folliculivorans TaxID=2886038 RepID=UPI003CFE1D48
MNFTKPPEEAINAYEKTWKIEIFFRNAKQELAITSCRSKYKESHKEHIEMIFMAETMLFYTNCELNEDGVVTLTYSEIICEIISHSHRISQRN